MKVFALWLDEIVGDPYIMISAESLEKIAEKTGGKLLKKHLIKPDGLEIDPEVMLEVGTIRITKNLFRDALKSDPGFEDWDEEGLKVFKLGSFYIYLPPEDKYRDLICREVPLAEL